MATKKVEEESVKNKKATNKSVDKNKKKTNTKAKAASKKSTEKEINKKTKKEDKKNVKQTDKKKSTKEVKEEKIVCEECGKKYLASLEKCPKCGYSIHDKKNSFYDDDEEEIYDEDEEYDDEDEFEERELDKKKKSKKEKAGAKKKAKDEKKEVKEQEKKYKEKKQKYVSGKVSVVEQNEDLVNLIKILIVIVLIVGIVYVVVALLNGEFKDEEKPVDDEVVETIQNDKILASSIFKKADDEYYVLIYDGSNKWADYYSMIYEEYSYIEDEDVLPLFWVDLSNKFNEDIMVGKDEKTNSKAQEYSELKVMSPTLIHIEDGENVDYYEGDEVVETLSDLIDSFKPEE